MMKTVMKVGVYESKAPSVQFAHFKQNLLTLTFELKNQRLETPKNGSKIFALILVKLLA